MLNSIHRGHVCSVAVLFINRPFIPVAFLVVPIHLCYFHRVHVSFI